MKASKPSKPYWEMNLAELREATKEFDQPIPPSKLSPMTRTEREQFEKSRKKGVAPLHIHRGRSKAIKVKLDESLLTRSAKYASRHNMTLSEVIERSLRSALAFVNDAG